MMAEILRALSRVWGIMRFDGQAAQGFENSVPALGRSFIAFFLALPIYLYTISLSLAVFGDKVNVPSLVISLILYQAIEWLLWANLMVGMATWMGARQYYCRYIVGYNWLTFAMMILAVPVQAGMYNGMTTGGLVFLAVAVFVLALIWQWSLAKHALQIQGGHAAGLVLTNLMMKLVLGQGMAAHLMPG